MCVFRYFMVLTTALVAATVCIGLPAAADRPISVAGTLTCAIEPQSGLPQDAIIDINCRFQPVNGRSTSYVGEVLWHRRNVDERLPAVLAWSVLAPQATLPANGLQGPFVAGLSQRDPTGPPNPPGLIGGWNNQIVLQTHAGAAAPDDMRRAAILRLRLTSGHN